MKTVLLTLFCLAGGLLSWAQKITVSESNKMMSLGQAPAQSVSIYLVEEKVVLKDFSKYLSKYKASTNIKKGELTAEYARIKSLNADSISFYANTEIISKTEARLNVFVRRKGMWLNSSDPIVQQLQKDLYDFAVNESRKPVEQSIKLANKKLDKQLNESADIQNENKKLKKETERCQKTIKDNESKVSENETYLSTLQKEIDELKKQLNELQQQLKNIK